MPSLTALSMIASVSYPRSARRYSAWNPSISCAATVQSAVVPEVIKNRTGIPFASTAKCILVLSPLLCGPSPDFHHVRQRRRDALSHDWRRSSATQNLCHLPGLPESFPISLCHAIGRTGGVHSSSFPTFPANPARALQCAESRILR